MRCVLRIETVDSTLLVNIKMVMKVHSCEDEELVIQVEIDICNFEDNFVPPSEARTCQ